MAKRAKFGLDREKFWRRVLGRWNRSRLTVAEFCRRESLASPTFYAWKRRLRDRSPRPSATFPASPTPAFLPVRVVPGSATFSGQTLVEVPLRDGRVVKISSPLGPRDLAGFVNALEEVRPC